MPIQAYAAKSAKGKLEPFEYEPGPLKPDEVEVKVTHCGICHSDLAMIDNEWGFSSYPVVPGHEVVGVVASVGERVTSLKPGQRVGVGWNCGSCGVCEWCNRSLESLCATQSATIVGHFGGFANAVRTSARFAVPIPDALESRVAGPLFCAGTTVFTPLMRHGVNARMKAAVVGIGGLGHLAVQFLAAHGCEVTAISTTHSKDEEAKKMGARHFIATKSTDELKKAANSFDFVISTITADVNWNEYFATLRPQGKFVFVGVPETAIPVPAFDIISAEKEILGGRTGSPSDIAQMLQFAADHGVRPVCEHFKMSDVNAAIDHLRAGKARYRVVLEA